MISLENCFSFINEKGPVLVAVSGGSDSMALLYLANAWAKNSGREIHAVTVDHGLRIEAAAEASFVAMVCDGLEIVHTTLAWDGIKPIAGISAAARNARYHLIEEFARDIGVRIILAGHNRDDQAETVLMRLRRNGEHTSSRGHSGMSNRTLLSGGGLLMRPLLDMSRKELRQYLNEISQSWIEDPSNHDHSYERVRVREELNANPSLKNQLIDYSQIMGRLREVVSRDAVSLLRQSCVVNSGHVYALGLEALENFPINVIQMALKIVIAVAGGAEYLVANGKLKKVVDYLTTKEDSRLTLGNCIVECGGGIIQIYREARNLKSAMIESGENLFWDGRVHISNDSDETIHIGVMSAQYIDAWNKDESNRGSDLSSVRKPVLLSTPLLTTGQGSSLPLFIGTTFPDAQIEVRTGARAIENFCPEWDFHVLDWLKGIDLAMGAQGLLHSDSNK